VHLSADQTKKTSHGISDMTNVVTTNAKEQLDKVFQISNAIDERVTPSTRSQLMPGARQRQPTHRWNW